MLEIVTFPIFFFLSCHKTVDFLQFNNNVSKWRHENVHSCICFLYSANGITSMFPPPVRNDG